MVFRNFRIENYINNKTLITKKQNKMKNEQFEQLKDYLIKKIINRDYEVLKVWDNSIDVMCDDIKLMFWLGGGERGLSTFDETDVRISLEHNDFRNPQMYVALMKDFENGSKERILDKIEQLKKQL